jgi:hypothetical protein
LRPRPWSGTQRGKVRTAHFIAVWDSFLCEKLTANRLRLREPSPREWRTRLNRGKSVLGCGAANISSQPASARDEFTARPNSAMNGLADRSKVLPQTRPGRLKEHIFLALL